MNNFYVYRHIRLDSNTPFYVGKGCKGRAFHKFDRSPFWHSIVAKHGYEVEIILENLTEEEAFLKEIEFTKLYKSFGYCEANFTLGGGGIAGYKWSPEQRGKLSKIRKGRKLSEETKKKMSTTNMGRVLSPEIRAKISKSHSGKRLSREHKENIGKSVQGELNGFFGRKHDAEAKEKMSLAKKGKPGPRLGITHSEETKSRISEARIGNAVGSGHHSWLGFVTTPFGVFDSTKKAADSLGLCREVVRRRCHSDNPKWREWFYAQSR